MKLLKRCPKMKGDIFDSRKGANNFRKSLIKQGFKKVSKVKKVIGCIPFTKIKRNYWKV